MSSGSNFEINFEAIGFARSTYPHRFGTPRQSGLAPESRAFIEIRSKFQPELSLDGLAACSHVWLIFVFHKNTNARFHAKVHPPRLKGETMGVFATRSPHRPNPVGLSLVTVESIEKNGLWVSGVDLIDGTPILDIKPYLPNVESKTDAKAGWVDDVKTHAVNIEWSASAQDDLSVIQAARPGIVLRDLIEQTVKLDPRPLVYHGPDGSESHYRDCHALSIENLDVRFYFRNRSHAVIEQVIILG
jgi:tRNA (adenine37-N6)-methyltransferase